MKCSCCGAPYKAEDRFCAYCGTGIAGQESRPGPQQAVYNVYNYYEAPAETLWGPRAGRSARKRSMALLLCFFFGVWGAHKFYVGRYGMGVLYLFTFGLFGLGWVFDIIMLLLDRATDRWGRRLS